MAGPERRIYVAALALAACGERPDVAPADLLLSVFDGRVVYATGPFEK